MRKAHMRPIGEPLMMKRSVPAKAGCACLSLKGEFAQESEVNHREGRKGESSA